MIPDGQAALEIKTDENGRWTNMEEIKKRIVEGSARAGVPIDQALNDALRSAKKVKSNGDVKADGFSPDEREYRLRMQNELAQRRAMELTTMAVDITGKLFELRSTCNKAGFQGAAPMLDKKINHLLHLIDVSIQAEEPKTT